MSTIVMMTARLTRAVFALMLSLAGLSTLLAERVQDLPKPANYVSDFAGVLSPQTIQGLNALCLQVDRQAHAQIAVVTIKSLDGDTIENFATQLEEAWKVGKKGTDRGVIGRSIQPALQAGNYDSAISSAVVQISQIIAADAGVNLQAAPRRGPPPQPVRQLTLGELIFGAIALFIFIFLFAKFAPPGTLGFLLGMFLGGGFGGGGRGGRGGDGFGGGGGDGGGGFGGFGGGSSGGGGASGDW